MFGLDAENALNAPTQHIIAYGSFALDGLMKATPVRGTEFNQVGVEPDGETSLHSRLFGFNHIVPEGFSLPEA
jgi:hypothetical protein